jgi:hypothetical protein
MKKLIIYGTGLIAEVADFYFKKDSAYQVASFTNSAEFIKEERFQGMPVVPFETLEKTHRRQTRSGSSASPKHSRKAMASPLTSVLEPRTMARRSA